MYCIVTVKIAMPVFLYTWEQEKSLCEESFFCKTKQTNLSVHKEATKQEYSHNCGDVKYS